MGNSPFDRLARLGPERLELLKKLQRQTAAPATPPSRDAFARSSANIPLNRAQSRMWRGVARDPADAAYHVTAVIQLRGHVDPSRLEHAVRAVICRHAGLRARFFDDTPHGPRQSIASPNEVVWELATRVADPHAFDLRAFADSEAVRPFDLARDILLRGTLVTWTEDRAALVLVAHHLICDGWSLAQVQREVSAAYDALAASEISASGVHFAANGHSVTTTDDQNPPASDSDILHDSHDEEECWLATEAAHASRDYWRRALAESPAPPSLATAARVPSDPTGPAATVHRIWSPMLSEQLRWQARAWQATPAMVLLAAWHILLARLAGDEECVSGLPFVNRDSAASWELVGLRVNTLPVRTILAGQPSFREFVGRTRDALLDATSHGRLPLEEILATLVPDDQVAIASSLTRLFVWQTAWELTKTQSFQVDEIDMGTVVRAASDLVLNVTPHGEGLRLTLVYRSDRFDSQTMALWLGHLETLLTDALNRPEAAVEDLRALTPAEELKLLSRSQGPTVPRDPSPDIVARILAHADHRPQSIALECGDQRMTYQKLREHVSRGAAELVRQGLGRGDVVGLLLPRGNEIPLTMLSVLHAGAAFLVLDPDSPPGRILAILRLAAAKGIITTPERFQRLAAENPMPIWIDVAVWTDPGVTEHPEAHRASSPAQHPAVCGPDDVAYLIGTSGSTGEPKLVAAHHAGFLDHALEFARRLALQPGERISQTLTNEFDASLEEIFPALLAGSALIIHPQPRDLAPALLCEFVEHSRIAVLHIVAPLFRPFADHLARQTPTAEGAPGLLPSLRAVVTGGDIIMSLAVARWFEGIGGRVPLHYLYGLTETSIASMAHRVEAEDALRDRVPLGTPLANHEVYVLDREGRLLPHGARGELWIGGLGVTLGYWGQPTLTSQRFRHIALGNRPPRRLYGTGDRGRWTTDHRLEFLGRIDVQTKIRGRRIEPGEIEAAILSFPEYQEARVVTRETGDGRKQLIAYVVTTASSSNSRASLNEDPRVLKNKLARFLPHHMLPTTVIFLETLPRHPNGKIAEARLPAPLDVSPSLDPKAPHAGTTPAERALESIWWELLDGRCQGIDEDFFGLGGDSILAMQVVQRARDAGWELTPSQLFTHPTIRQLATIAQHRGNGADAHTAVPDDEGTDDRSNLLDHPLGPAQRMFFAWNLPRPCHFQQVIRIQVPDAWDAATVKQGWLSVLRTHPILRSAFVRDPGADPTDPAAWTQRYPSSNGLEDTEERSKLWRQTDLRDVGDSCLEGRIEQAIRETQATIDPFQGPIAVAHWLWLPRTAETSNRSTDHVDLGATAILILAAHHLVVDGVSWRVLLDELEQECTRDKAGLAPAVPVPATSYARWVGALESAADVADIYLPRLPAQESLAGGHATPLRMDQASVVEMEVDRFTTAALLGDANQAYQTRTDELLLAALTAAIQDSAGVAECRIDWERHGRDIDASNLSLERSIGWFTRVVPLTLSMPPSAWNHMPQDDSLPAVPDAEFLGVIPHIKESIRGQSTARDRTHASPPPADYAFNYLGQWRNPRGNQHFRLLPTDLLGLSAPENIRTHAWDVIAAAVDGRLQLRLVYSRLLADETSALRFLERIRFHLQRIVRHCDHPHSGRLTASDVSGQALSSEELDRLNAQLFSEALAANDINISPRLRRRDIAGVAAVTPPQALMLLHALTHPGVAELVEQLELVLHGPLDPPRFRRAWSVAVARHEALRTRFVLEGVGLPLQVVLRDAELPWTEIDLRMVAENSLDERWRGARREERDRPMDLRRAPLMRIALARCPEEYWRVCLTCHHAIVDGWSLPLILRDVFQAYAEEANQGKRVAVSGSSGDGFRRFVTWRQTRDHSASKAWCQAHFHEDLLPGSRVERAVNRGRVGRVNVDDQIVASSVVELELSTAWTTGVAQLARRHHVSVASVAMAAWGTVVAEALRVADFHMGVVVAGRPSDFPGVDSIVGAFAQQLPLRMEFEKDESLGRLLARVHQDMAGLTADQSVTLAEIATWCPRAAARPIPAAFVFENYPHGLPSRPDPQVPLKIVSVEGTAFSTAPWMLVVVPGEHWTARWISRTEPGHPPMASNLLAAWRNRVAAWSQNADDVFRIVVQEPVAFSALETSTDASLDGPPNRSPNISRSAFPTIQEPPASPLETELIEIWRDVLGIAEFGIHDPFPELGGTSLQAMQLLERVHARFGRRLPLVALYAEPTIAAHARILADENSESAQSESALVPLRGEPGNTPGNATLYCVHPAGGTVFCYQALAELLPAGIRVIGLQARGIDGRSRPHASVEAMARAYVEQVLASQPRGPYALCGWSSGGIVAFEMARQMRASGVRIELLALLDAAIRTDGGEYTGDDIASMLKLMFSHVDPGHLDALRDADEDTVLRFFKEQALRAGLVTQNQEAERLLAVYEVFKSNARAMGTYQASTWPDPLLVIRAASAATTMHNTRALGWEKLAAGVEVETVSGDHLSMLRPPAVHEVAGILGRRLAHPRTP